MAVQLGYADSDLTELAGGGNHGGAGHYNGETSTAGYVEGYAAGLVAGGFGVTYRMRAYDAVLTRPVYWNSASIDSAGFDYAGPGPLSDVVVFAVQGG